MSIIGSNKVSVVKELEEWFRKHASVDAQPIIVDNKGKIKPYINVYGDISINVYQKKLFPKNINFGHIYGNFSVQNSQISTMTSFPTDVDGDFICYGCHNISSLKRLPKYIGGKCTIRCCGRPFTKDEVQAICEVKGEIIVN